MNRIVSFEMPNYTLDQIKKDYFLYDLCVPGTLQLENVAITIQSLYFYYNILSASKYPKSISSSMCRTIIIMSYSIIEAIVIFVGYKIQMNCANCRHACNNCCISMFELDDENMNERKAFVNADKYLRDIGILNFTSEAEEYYDNFRNSRNNVHLGRNSSVITSDPNYTIEQCRYSIEFFQNFIKTIHTNLNKYVYKFRCGR